MLKKIISNTMSQMLSKVLTAIISIFLLSILTNHLSVELFWIYSKIYNYLWIFAFLADLWLYTLMIREISNISDQNNNNNNNRITIDTIVWNILTLRVGMWIIIIFLALLIAYFLPWYNGKIEMWWIGIIWVFTLVSLMNSTFLAYMQSQLKMEFSLFSVVLWKMVNIAGISLIIFVIFWINEFKDMWWSGLLLIFYSGLIGITVNTILNFLYARKSCKITFLFDWNYIKYIFTISLPYWIALFLSVVYFKIDIILLSILEWDKADVSIALYWLPMKIIEVLMVMWWFYLNSVLPQLSTLFQKKQTKKVIRELHNLLHISFKILFTFWISIFTFWTLFWKHIITIIANKEYVEPLNHIYNSSQVFYIVLLILLFYSISLLYIYIFIAKKQQWILLKINIFITLFNIIGNIVIIPYYSFIWAWIITLLSQILLYIITAHFSKKIIIFKIPVLFIIKILIISVLFFITIYYLLLEYSLWLYLDICIYGMLWFWIYSLLIIREVKK